MRRIQGKECGKINWQKYYKVYSYYFRMDVIYQMMVSTSQLLGKAQHLAIMGKCQLDPI